eukprot:scaffold61024_cov53-Phaeocystis_antarctica.AAC.5
MPRARAAAVRSPGRAASRRPYRARYLPRSRRSCTPRTWSCSYCYCPRRRPHASRAAPPPRRVLRGPRAAAAAAPPTRARPPPPR